MLRIQSTTTIEQPPFNDWAKYVHSVMSPKAPAYRHMTEGEKEFAVKTIREVMALRSADEWREILRSTYTHIEYIPTGFLTLEIMVRHDKEIEDDRWIDDVTISAHYVFIDRFKEKKSVTNYVVIGYE